MKKSQNKNFKPFISPLAGSRFRILRDLKEKYPVHNRFRRTWFLTRLVSGISSILAIVDEKKWSKKNKVDSEPPLFIIGHWRSGTTLLHNSLCHTGDVSFTTTYQGVFPNNLFFMKWLFKGFMRIFMPDERPADSVKIDINFPQEEEIALGNEIPFSYYYWFYFPLHTMEFAEKFLLGKVDHEQKKEWSTNYQRFVQRSIANKPGRFFVSKNPPHTFRIKELLSIYPKARFIFIHRNPYDVFLSCRRFFRATVEGIQLQEFENEAFDDNLLNVYKMMMDAYSKTRHLIPSNQLVELSYDAFLNDPMKQLQDINKKLNLRFTEQHLAKVGVELEKRSSHTVKKYDYKEQDVSKVNAHWSSLLDDFGYRKTL